MKVRGLAIAAMASALMLSACEPPEPPPPPDPARGEECMRNRDWACAEQEFRAYLRLYPNDNRRTALLAITLTRAGKHREALPFYDRAEAAGLGTYDLFALHANSLDAVGDTERAITFNRRALELVPQLVDVRGHLAEELVRLGRHQEAIDLLQEFDDQTAARGQGRYFQGQIMSIRGQMRSGAGQASNATSPSGRP